MKRLGVFAVLIAAFSLVSGARTAAADEPWLVETNLQGAAPLNNPYEDRFGLGLFGGAGVYRPLIPHLLIGARLHFGFLSEEDEVPAPAGDPEGNYETGTLFAALRLRPLADPDDHRRATGLWIEVGAGPGLVESEVRPVLEAGLGYNFPVGNIALGPTVGYLQFIESDQERFEDKDARIVTAGIEIIFGDHAHETIPYAAVPEAPVEPAPVEPAPVAAAPSNTRGFVNDRQVIDERVFFDFDQSELRPQGKEKLDEIAEYYGEDGSTWLRLRILGHADQRGPASYNVELSRARARAVSDYLASHGVPAERLDIEAYGESRPVVPDATTPEEYQLNRRVEFVIERNQPATDAVPPGSP